MITSPLMDQEYDRLFPEHTNVWRTPEALLLWRVDSYKHE
jgi:hypothetical protein